MVASFLWQMPSPHNPAAKLVLGGWQLNGIVTLRSGSPFTVSSGRDTQLSFQTTRANLIGNPNLPSDRPRGQVIAKYFDPAAFAVPATGSLGDSVRNL